MIKSHIKYLNLLAILFIFACSSEPDEIDFGLDSCNHCRMVIADKRFSARILNNTYKTYKFDSIECMAAYMNEKNMLDTDYKDFYCQQYNQPNLRLKSSELMFMISNEIKSPMGLNIIATKTQGSNEQKSLRLDEVRKYVEKNWNN
jgi:copper chaperone NosL